MTGGMQVRCCCDATLLGYIEGVNESIIHRRLERAEQKGLDKALVILPAKGDSIANFQARRLADGSVALDGENKTDAELERTTGFRRPTGDELEAEGAGKWRKWNK